MLTDWNATTVNAQSSEWAIARICNIIKRNVYCLRKYLSLSKTIEKLREKEKQTE
jgi:hypothetical protein